ncbi:MAG: transcriptional regulator [Alphaproteobacteria bacterium]|nr:transcriptional regulator [Alphaproteobacteria bacterium]MDP6588811.1 transcriptional regulator [Alphaproteobacteria bacterium]MDP6818895.1 transcriptional regulator [Alphaproteobacteria bacterium]
MSELGQRLLESLQEAAAHARGEPNNMTTETYYFPLDVDVKAVRHKTGATQVQFAKLYGFKVSSVRAWEQGRRKPSQSARILLKVIEKRPDIIHQVFTGELDAETRRKSKTRRAKTGQAEAHGRAARST